MIVRDHSLSVSLGRQLASMRAAARAFGAPALGLRRSHLTTIEGIVRSHTSAIARAIAEDFGRRSLHETRLLEIFPTVEAARYARRHIATWMAPERVPVALHFRPARARVVRQPVGIVGIIVPWNYPLLLAFGPLIAALAAGNRVMIKMSDLSPHIAELLARILADEFAPDHVNVDCGGAAFGKAFAALPFDHLFFTGSTETGRSVMRAAAANLTPVTLELGGKSPAIIGADAPIAIAAQRIMSGKCRNAGQTCIAPDYALLPADRIDAFVSAANRIVSKRYPLLPGGADYTSIVSPAHYDRLTGLLADATAKGATVVPLGGHAGTDDGALRSLPPAIVLDVRDDMRIMHEEIFGPLLPLVAYQTLDEALAYVEARPRPLALYYFGTSSADVERVVRQTHSGGVCVNDVMLQFAQNALPFGGTGASGMGAYHGRTGFETFSHRKAVFDQARLSGTGLLEPPYGRLFDGIVRLLQR